MSQRSVSVALGYVLVLSLTVILVGGLIIGSGSFVETQQDQAAKEELAVIGAQVAGNVEQVDRMVIAANDSPDHAVINEPFQQRVSGDRYTVRLVTDETPRLVLEPINGNIEVTVPLTIETDIAAGTSVTGGQISVRYNDTDGLVIENA